MVQAEIITVGDELISGIVIDTNAAYIGEKLFQLGIQVRWITTIGDDERDIQQALETSYKRASLVIITGGLGPTHDDITKKVVSEFFQSELVFNSEVFEQIEKRYKKLDRKPNEDQREQAEVPEKADVIENTIGTAPGMQFTQEGRTYFILPGVPSEMKRMLDKSIVPAIKRSINSRELVFQIIRTAGIFESELSRRIGAFNSKFPEIKLSLLPQTQGVTIRLMVPHLGTKEGKRILHEGENYIRENLEGFIIGTGDAYLEEVIGDLLKKRSLTIAVAESCTGGLIAHKLTNVPESSLYFNRGVIAYHNDAKINILGVPDVVLEKHGAVSAETAVAMAEGIRRISGTDIGISTTGIAGPGGATPKKPVGLVYIGYSDTQRSFSESHIFSKSRVWNKERFAVTALNLVRRVLLDYISNPL